MTTRRFPHAKVPEVFALFWVAKLLTTGIGETAADYMGTKSLVIAGLVGVLGFFVALGIQLRADTYHPVRYWMTVLMVAVFGTMIADGPHVALGSPYWLDSLLYAGALVALLAWWRTSEGTFSVHSITTPRRERFYWGTVLLTFGLGTALGDTTAANFHLGFAWSIAIFGVLILLPLLAWTRGADSVVCFWIAYALTRPLGASIADGMAVHPQHGGLGWGTGPVTAVGLVLFALLVTSIAITRCDSPVDAVEPSAGHAQDETAAPRELDLATD